MTSSSDDPCTSVGAYEALVGHYVIADMVPHLRVNGVHNAKSRNKLHLIQRQESRISRLPGRSYQSVGRYL